MRVEEFRERLFRHLAPSTIEHCATAGGFGIVWIVPGRSVSARAIRGLMTEFSEAIALSTETQRHGLRIEIDFVDFASTKEPA